MWVRPKVEEPHPSWLEYPQEIIDKLLIYAPYATIVYDVNGIPIDVLDDEYNAGRAKEEFETREREQEEWLAAHPPQEPTEPLPEPDDPLSFVTGILEVLRENAG